jgi:hypothetical protein
MPVFLELSALGNLALWQGIRFVYLFSMYPSIAFHSPSFRSPNNTPKVLTREGDAQSQGRLSSALISASASSHPQLLWETGAFAGSHALIGLVDKLTRRGAFRALVSGGDMVIMRGKKVTDGFVYDVCECVHVKKNINVCICTCMCMRMRMWTMHV